MTRFIIVIILIINCAVIFGGVHVMAGHPGQSLDIEEFFSFGWNAVTGLLCVAAAVLIVAGYVPDSTRRSNYSQLLPVRVA